MFAVHNEGEFGLGRAAIIYEQQHFAAVHNQYVRLVRDIHISPFCLSAGPICPGFWQSFWQSLRPFIWPFIWPCFWPGFCPTD